MSGQLPPSEMGDGPKKKAASGRRKKAATPKPPEEKGTEFLDLPDELDEPAERVGRRTVAGEGELSPDTLVGSWFLRVESGAVSGWGIVVAQVQAEPLEPMYLVEFHAVESIVQRIVKLSQMFSDTDDYEWRFYDTDEAMRLAYAVQQAKERAT